MQLAGLSILLFFVAIPFTSFADDTPNGESVSQHFTTIIGSLKYNSKMLIAENWGDTFIRWSPPKDRDIVYAAVKDSSVKSRGHTVFILLDDGAVYEMVFVPYFGWNLPTLRSNGGPTFVKLVGDALYGIASSGIPYVSRDSAATWQIDTTGLGSGYPYDVAVDTLQYVYLAYSTGLFKQHPDSSSWYKVSSFPASYTSAVFVDRTNRVFVASSKKAYVSTDAGATWTIDTLGLEVSDVLGLTGFCDDVFGNIYARSATGLWRSTAGTQPWTRIDQSLTALAFDPSVNVLFNSLSGDSLLYASTVFGSYVSSNQGTSWMPDSLQFDASFIYGLVKTSAGRLLTSTNLGVYYKDPGDLQWTKTFPSTGFVAASPVFLDGSGNAYALGAKINPSNFESLRANWKSTDGGSTWNPDTAGIGGLAGQDPTYYVDENGTQYYGAFDTPAKFYRKAPGQNWIPDTSGYTGNTTDYPTIFASDKHGSVYVATLNIYNGNGMIWKHPVAGGTWIIDTAGLSNTQVYWITADKNGVALAGAIDGLYQKNGATWTKLPSPSGLNGYSAFVCSADSAGYIVAGFSTPYGLNYFWRGLYATNNSGVTWNYLGLDSISVRGLVSYGDTTYAYTYADGLYKVRSTAGVNSVKPGTTPALFQLEQNYPNPFNPSTMIQFTVPSKGYVVLKVFNVLGQEVATLFDGEATTGLHQVTFDATKFASGVYFCRMDTGNFSATEKLLLLR
jgi:Secretion system C-terminal sorting domain